MRDEGGLTRLLTASFDDIATRWIDEQTAEGVGRADLIPVDETRAQSRELLSALLRAMEAGGGDGPMADVAFDEVRDVLARIAEARIDRGVTPTEMAWFMHSLKPALFATIRSGDAPIEAALDEVMMAGRVVDRMAIHAMDSYVEKRETVIERQRAEMNEVSAPVVKLWDRIVTVPLIGTLDSWRAQTVMENLLEAIVAREAEVAIIDITGVGTVDTMVAQHLLKTAAAVRLMGAECVICGVSPKIAQTVVHLGVDLPNVVTRIDLESGLDYAFRKIGLKVVERDRDRERQRALRRS